MRQVVTKIFVDTPPCDSRRHLDDPYVPSVRLGYLLCDICLEDVETALVDLPEWYARCEDLSAKKSRADAVQVLSDIIDTLWSWCALVANRRGVRAPDQPNIALLTGFLGVHMQWLTTRPGAVEFADDLALLGATVHGVPTRHYPWLGLAEPRHPDDDPGPTEPLEPA